MKTLLLILATLFISGCGQKVPCTPVPCVKVFPKLPIYGIPTPKKMTEPVHIGGGMFAVVGTELEGCLQSNAKLRRVCKNNNLIHTRINKEYQ